MYTQPRVQCTRASGTRYASHCDPAHHAFMTQFYAAAPTIHFQTRTPAIRLAWCWLARTSSPRAAHPPPRSATSSATPTCTWWNGIWRDGNIQWYLCVVNVILVSRYERIDILFVCERGRMYHTRIMRHFVHPGGS